MKWVVYHTMAGHVDVIRAEQWDDWMRAWGDQAKDFNAREICRVETMTDALNLCRLANDQRELEREDDNAT